MCIYFIIGIYEVFCKYCICVKSFSNSMEGGFVVIIIFIILMLEFILFSYWLVWLGLMLLFRK